MSTQLDQAKADLIVVNAAIANLIAGKRVTQIRVTSGDFHRFIQNTEVSLQELRDYREYLLAFINSMEAATTVPTFRTFSTIPLIVTKDYNQ